MGLNIPGIKVFSGLFHSLCHYNHFSMHSINMNLNLVSNLCKTTKNIVRSLKVVYMQHLAILSKKTNMINNNNHFCLYSRYFMFLSRGLNLNPTGFSFFEKYFILKNYINVTNSFHQGIIYSIIPTLHLTPSSYLNKC